MSKQFKDEDVQKLYQELLKPLENVEVAEVNSETEAQTTMNFLKSSLETKNDWAQKKSALELATRYIAGGIYYYNAGNPTVFIPQIKNLLSDLRIASVKEAITFIIFVAHEMKAQAAKFMLKILEIIMKLLARQNQAIANAAHICILETVKYVASPDYAIKILSFFKSEEPSNRQAVAECCAVVFNSWPAKVYPNVKDALINALTNLISDNNSVISELSDEILKKATKDSDGSEKRTVDKNFSIKIIPVVTKQKKTFESPIKRTPRSSPMKPKKERVMIPDPEEENSAKNEENEEEEKPQKETFSSLLNAVTNDQIIRLIKFIGNANANDEWQEIDEEKDKLGQSIVSCIQKRKKAPVWVGTIAIIFHRYKEELRTSIFPILSLLNHDKDIMKIALEEYVPEELINTLANMKGCERNPYAFQFLVALAEYPESETMINLKAALKKEGDSTLNVKQIPNVLQYINAVVAQNKLNKSVEIINEYIARNTCESIEKILEAAVAKLSRGDDAKDECSRLQELYKEDDKETVTQSLDRSIPKLIESGDEQQLLRALSMITLFSKFKGVTFGTSLVPIVNVMLNDDKHSSECLQAMSIILLDVPSMAKAFSIAEKDEDEEERSRRIICNAIYVFFKKLPPQKIVPLLKAVTTKLTPFANDRDEDVRSFVVNTFIEMYKKLPVIFAKQLKKMPPALQRTVMIAASKQK